LGDKYIDNDMKTKNEKIREAIQQENWKMAFSLGNGFSRDFEKEDRKTIQRAHEIIGGMNAGKRAEDYYIALGFDPDDVILSAKIILIKTYRINNSGD
jgi:hypothetical protein